ncbi:MULTISPECIES: CHASE2 domain-containing protein [Rhizobium]|uniref:CHASE2 domain-containing protein n=1 Tax=Rhizobium phaseoli TaxID=396 RepID=UPI0004D56BB8|nr:adenylate/guanylate cyclase domain-containing protein [Rhizobium phaseoli]ANL35807.1 adenylate cyclase family 3 protein [Rhizobium phaseoli]ANL99530.1 adenylate cyclase family 3 protein [Rhizobium phaseoli]KEC74600.1 adenylate cyclase [Rhizobium leguminosarum bv. phaseoli CCGM1]PWI52778.1 adenylate/guanylate cyclase domain-containing protein [Rhizobium phaseoli]
MTRAQQIGVVIGLAIVAALTMLRADDPGIFKLIRGVTFDEYQRLVPRSFEPMPVRVVDIDEASLREFGQWPWPRDRLALLVDRLSQMGAAAIAFDVLFAEPDRLSPRNVVREVAGVDPLLAEKLPDNDEIFAGSIAGKPVVLGFGLSNEGGYRPPVKAGFAFTGESPVSAPPFLSASTPLRPQLEANAAGLGHISLNPGNPSPVVRAVPLFVTDGEQLYPNLAIEALRVAQGVSTYVLSGAPDRAGVMTSAKIGDFVVPLTAAGELWLYVTPDRAERYISARQVIAGAGVSPDVAAAINGSIIFVGTSAAGLQDIRVTALGENVPGVSLHAQAVEQILSGQFLSRPDWADGLEILVIAVLGCLLVVVTTFVSPAVALICGLLITAMALVASWLSFLYAGLLFDPLAPIISGSITHFAATSFRILVIDRERRAVRRAFGHYLSPSLLHRIEHTRDALRLGGDDRELTVMFVDVRNFTEISERLAPAEVVRFLNTLLDALSRHVVANEGTLDKFIGDSIMAFWNAPIDVTDHATKAVRAALAMRETLAELNAGDAFGFGPGQQVGIGIGIHTGLACVGNMGAKTRFNYSAVGDAVNVAARIESCCKEVGFDILISDSTAKLVQTMALVEAGAIPLKGKSSRTKILAVVGNERVAASREFAALDIVHRQLIQALHSHSKNTRKLVGTAKLGAAQVIGGLTEFYQRISARTDHFRDMSEDVEKNAAD